MPSSAEHTLGALAREVGGRLIGDSERRVSWVATLAHAGPNDVSFLHNPRYRRQLSDTRAGVVLLTAADAEACPVNAIVVPDPYLAYARIAARLAPQHRHPGGVHPSAIVDERAQVHETAWVGPQCVIEAGVRVGPGCDVGPGCVLGRDVELAGDDVLLARVTLCAGTQLGARVRVQPGAVIGSDGFGYANDGGGWIPVPQLGRVRIGDDVQIGANTTIDRGAIEDTVIEEGAIIDNLVQIAHNVFVGAHSALAGCVGIAGSTRIGRHCAVGGGVGISGHLHIADHVTITGGSTVLRSIGQPGVYSSGVPLEPNASWHRNYTRFKRLDEFAKRLGALEKQGPVKLQKD